MANGVRYECFESPERRLPQAASDYRRWFLGRLRTLEPVVSKQAGICAGRFTMADISIGYALLLAEYLGMEPEFPASLRSYWRQLKARDGYCRARDAEVAAAVVQGVSTIPAPLLLPTV